MQWISRFWISCCLFMTSSSYHFWYSTVFLAKVLGKCDLDSTQSNFLCFWGSLTNWFYCSNWKWYLIFHSPLTSKSVVPIWFESIVNVLSKISFLISGFRASKFSISLWSCHFDSSFQINWGPSNHILIFANFVGSILLKL